MFGRLLAGFFFIWKLFALTDFIFYLYIGDFEILGVETLRREFSGGKFGTWVAWIFRLDSFLLKWCPNMPGDGARDFPPSIIFGKSWSKLKVRFSHSKLVKILDFPKLGQRLPGTSPTVSVHWKVVGCRCFDVWEWLDCFVGHFEPPSSLFMRLSMLSMAILSFLVENTGSEASRSFPDHFSWLKICLKHFQMMFGRLLGGFFFIWNLFALTTFICYVYMGDFEILRAETLRPKVRWFQRVTFAA